MDSPKLRALEMRLNVEVELGRACSECVGALLDILSGKSNDDGECPPGCNKCAQSAVWREATELVVHEGRYTAMEGDDMLTSPKLRELEARLDVAEEISTRQAETNRAALSRLRDAVENGVEDEEEDDEPGDPSSNGNSKKAKITLDIKRYQEESRLFRIQGFKKKAKDLPGT
jgi:hypothetical protein